MSKDKVPTYIRVDGLLLKRVDAPEMPPAGSGELRRVWHALVMESETTSRHSPDMGDVMEEEGPSSVVLDLMAADRRAAVEAVKELMHAGDGPSGRWNLRIEKKLHQMSIDDAMQYIHDGWTHADELIGQLKDDGLVVLENALDLRTAASPRQGFTIEEAEKAATDMGLDLERAAYGAEQLRMGMDVELEHGKRHAETNITNDHPVKTAQIAWAHLMELPDYYDRLARMEQGDDAIPAEHAPSGAVDVLTLEDDVPENPKYVSVRGHLYALEQDAPEYIEVAGQRFRKSSVADIREAKGKKGLPKGWTEDSAKESWKTTKKKAPVHPVTHCIEQLKGKPEIDDPGALCAWRADQGEGTAWRHKKRKKKKKKKEARIDYDLPDNHPGKHELGANVTIPIRMDKRAAAYLAGLGGEPVKALASRLHAQGTTLASLEELQAAVAAVVADDNAPDWILDDLENALVDARSQY